MIRHTSRCLMRYMMRYMITYIMRYMIRSPSRCSIRYMLKYDEVHDEIDDEESKLFPAAQGDILRHEPSGVPGAEPERLCTFPGAAPWRLNPWRTLS